MYIYIYARKQDFLVHFNPKNVTQSSCSLLWSRQKRVCCYFVRKCGRRAGSSRIIMVAAGEQLNFSGALGAAVQCVHQNSIQPNRRSALTGTVYSIFLSSKPVKFRCAILKLRCNVRPYVGIYFHLLFDSLNCKANIM